MRPTSSTRITGCIATKDICGWVARTRQVPIYSTRQVISSYTATKQVVSSYTATKTWQELTGYTATKQVVDRYDNTYVPLGDSRLTEHRAKGYTITERKETRTATQVQYEANPGAYPGAVRREVPGTLKRRLVGYQPRVTVTTPGGWRSSPEFVETEVVLGGDFTGDVTLSVSAPSGIEATLLPVGGGGDLGVEVGGSGSGAEINGQINSGSNSTLVLHKASEARARLRVSASSGESMAGSYTVVVRASGGGVQREARFGVNINVTCD